MEQRQPVAAQLSQPVPPPPPPSAEARPPAPKPRSWGDVKLSSVIPDLNNILTDKPAEEEATDEPELLSGTERQAFDHETLLQHWHALADKLKAENKINLFTLMTANTPQLQPDFNIGVVIENPIQRDLLIVSKVDILNELRTNLRNFAIDLVPIEVKGDTARKPYTAQEKYQAMAAKNPALDVLRKTFNLGLE